MKQKFNSVRSTALENLLIKEDKMNMKTYVKTYFCLLLLSLLVVFSAAPAWAITAANTQIINQAQLSYNDGTGTQLKTASVTVTVSLVPSAPTIVAGGPYSTNYATGATLTDTFTITSTSNGPDTYNYSAATGIQVNNTSTGTATPIGSSIIIGATVTIAGSTTTVINVPYDGVSDGIENGIAVGNTVVISGVVDTVQSISENAGTGVTTITLTVALPSAPVAGVLVAGQKTVTVTVAAGTIVTAGNTVVVPADLTAYSNTDNTKTTTSSYATNSFYSGLATFNKYVRNVTTPAAGTTLYTWNSNNYYASGITAKPGEILEYILVCHNTGTGNITASVVTDTVPTAYAIFQTGIAAYGGKDIYYIYPALASAPVGLTAASDADQGVYVASTLTAYVGSGATNSVGGEMFGTISNPPNGDYALVLFQVKVNP